MGELNKTLHQLTLAQYVLAVVFLLGYGTALGSMFGRASRLRALLLALLAAAGFAALTRPWEHGVLLILCAIGGVGLFIAVAWVFSAVTASARWVDVPQSTAQSRRPPRLRVSAALVVAKAARAAKRRKRHRTI